MKKLRQEFADTLLATGESDSKLVVMVGDISHGILQPFAKAFPDRYYNVGICEPTIVNMAAGLNKIGLTPVVHTIAPFIIERAYEQIKLDFGYQGLSINLVSVGGSFDYAQLGCSHHCYADVSLMSHFKRANIFLPGSAEEFNKLFTMNYSNGMINYFRLTEFPHGIDIPEELILHGKGIVVREGSDITLAVVGPQLKNAVIASTTLASKGISAEIIYFPTIKPFDEFTLANSVKKTKKLLTIEELSAHDGLHSLCIKACIGINDLKVRQIAIEDFIHGYGSYDDLCNKTGLNPENIARLSISLM